MFLGALVDLGLPLDDLRRELAKVPVGGYRLEAQRVHRSGLHATKVDVVIEHELAHHVHHTQPHGGHQHRGIVEIVRLLEGSGLEPAVKTRAVALFRRLAEVEAAVHGVPAESVHFHEVGAVDAIVDVVGTVIGLNWLRADRFVASPLNVGSGTVTMSHGTFPVPPPATASLIKGVPVFAAGEGELLTPTGALLVTGFASSYGALPRFRPEAVGHGAGTRDVAGRPNVLRVIVGEAEAEGAEAGAAAESILVLETEVDDTPAQFLGPLLDLLLAAGALDAFYTPIHMKKGRPGILITVLSPLSAADALEDVLFRETTTLGVRRQEWRRTALEREIRSVSTRFGDVRVKVGRRHGRVCNVQPEFEDCARAAREHGVPAKEVWAAALAAAQGTPGAS
jgi:uncharacterized protein (TIGR00299 family) protein